MLRRQLLSIFALLLLLALTTFPCSVAASTLTVNTTDDTDDGACDGMHCSLREAIKTANANAGPDEIDFAFIPAFDPGCSAISGVCTIQPLTELPWLNDDGTTIDGYSQTGAEPAAGLTAAKIRVVLDGSAIVSQTNGLTINDSGDHVIKGLAIVNFTGNGIYISGAGATNATVEGCHIGVDYLGTTAAPNGLRGVFLNVSASANIIGGTTPAARNVISGNSSAGVELIGDSNENMIMGNFIGTDATGMVDLGNGGSGVYILQGAYANLVGGAAAGTGNVISGNEANGVSIYAHTTNDNQVEGNLIGLAVDGAIDLGNTSSGIEISGGAHDNIIGGATALTRNVISGNGQHGILIWTGGSNYNLVTGNYIGTNAWGTAAVPNNTNGVYVITGAQYNTVGGDSVGERNVISGNGLYGVFLASPNNAVTGNYIGTHVSGASAIPNQYGVGINDAGGNTIGGSALGEGNLISGNTIAGVVIQSANAAGNSLLGNHIGVDSSGDMALGNGSYGVYVTAGAHGNTIGGTGIYEGNQISANSYGIYISGAGTDSNLVTGNLIGTDGAGDLPLPNAYGIYILQGAQSNSIGGNLPGEGNVISGNDSSGVFISGEGTDANTVCGNIIGLNDQGTSSLPNSGTGVELYNGPELTVIGGSSGCRNVISANASDGVRITGSSTSGNTVSGNYIGLDASGSMDRGNTLNGVTIAAGSTDNVIGGETDAARNVISGNDQNGVDISGTASSGNRVIGNYIGTDSTGLADIGNQSDGIKLAPSMMNTEIGGDTPGERNVISGNGSMGIRLTGVNILGTVISGNYIGVDVTGVSALANDGYGIYLNYGPQSTVIGGELPAEGNIISGNQFGGVVLNGTAATGNTIKGNLIGVGAGGLVPVPNGGDGIQVNSNAIDNTIGPVNQIWYNAGDGISVDAAYHATITHNSIYLNEEKGINLVGSANEGMLAPTITQASPGSLFVEGIGAPPDATIELFSSPNSDGEGKKYLGSTTADVSGAWSLTVGCSSEPFLTTTATNLAGSTSEFSLPFTSTVSCLYLPLMMR